MLEVVTRGARTWGLLLHQQLATVSVDRLALACDGYLVITTELVRSLCGNGLRLDIVGTLSPEELCILSHLGAALSNREIAEASGIYEGRVRVMTRTLTRKLQLKNRTMLAVFAIENERLLSLMMEKTPNS